jgi:hypothetical protein
MTVRGWIALTALLLAACSPATRAPAGAAVPAPRPTPPPPTAELAPAPPAPALLEAPEDWHLRDAAEDGLAGAGVTRAYRELLASRTPGRTVVVAVIDSGVDTAHVDLRANLWRNENEVPGNGIDDDGNGYIDDVHGWNFLGSADGEAVQYDTFEVTRLHAACIANGSTPNAPADCDRIAQDFQQRRTEAEQTLLQVRQIQANLDIVLPMLQSAIGSDSLTVTAVTALRSQRGDVMQARDYFLALAGAGISPADVREAETAYQTQLEYNLNPAFEPRPIVGDDYEDMTERLYGNCRSHGARTRSTARTWPASSRPCVTTRSASTASRPTCASWCCVPYRRRRTRQGCRQRDPLRRGQRRAHHQHELRQGLLAAQGGCRRSVRHADESGVLHGPRRRQRRRGPGEQVELSRTAATPMAARAAQLDRGRCFLVEAADSLGRAVLELRSGRSRRLRARRRHPFHSAGRRFERQNGTSMAAPVVTGVAAMLMAYFPSFALRTSVAFYSRAPPPIATGPSCAPARPTPSPSAPSPSPAPSSTPSKPSASPSPSALKPSPGPAS